MHWFTAEVIRVQARALRKAVPVLRAEGHPELAALVEVVASNMYARSEPE